MKVLLMHRNRDFDWQPPLPPQADALRQDLELDTLLEAMAAGDRFLHGVATAGLLVSLRDPDEIRYRQSVLADCLEQAAMVRAIYDLAVEALAAERHVFPALESSVDSVLSRAVHVLELFADALDRLRQVAKMHAGDFRSEGFTRFFATVAEQVDDAYLQTVRTHLRELTFPRGVLINTRLGRGSASIDLALHKPPATRWIDRLVPADFAQGGYTFEIAPRDQGGLEALGELRRRAANEAVNAAAQAADHIHGFFSALRGELGFYVGCLNLHERLTQQAGPVSFPDPTEADTSQMTTRGLYDPSLALHLKDRAIGNDVDATGRSLVMITGANQGGKSTFLRSVGQAQLMMQAGMFVPAAFFRASVCSGVFTHFKREEDVSMTSGKFDEELGRMSAMVDQLVSGSILLCNESFASTNEQEGSEIGRQVVRALLDAGVRVFFVTHLFTLAHGFSVDRSDAMLFLRAERLPDGRRTFRLIEGEPEPTSYGADAYRRVFNEDDGTAEAAAAGEAVEEAR
jgi:hypothetical protein